MKVTLNSKLSEIMSSESGRTVLEKYLPVIRGYANLATDGERTMKDLESTGSLDLDKTKLRAIFDELQNIPDGVISLNASQKSLDDIDADSFNAGPSPFTCPPDFIELRKGEIFHPAGPAVMLLDGEWQLAAEGDETLRLAGEWSDAIAAKVPGSIHSALVEAGRIPDPAFGVNQKIAKMESYKTWWLKRSFACPERQVYEKIVFDGIANKCTIWLNGKKLGNHEGMFGGPEFEITQYLQEDNILIVKLEPIPLEADNIDSHNTGWMKTVVFNNVYGWHYSNLPSLGIWRSVRICGTPYISMQHPFIVTGDTENGIIDLLLQFNSDENNCSGLLKCTIRPDSFQGEAYSFEKVLGFDGCSSFVRLQFAIPNFKLWWPVDLGEPNLYSMILSFTPGNGGTPDKKQMSFGLRKVEMAPLPEGKRTDKYNWTFVINGKQCFIKGAGWCTMDPLMDFSQKRYERFISLAEKQHIQMLRAWGSGMPETDEFYDACNRYGIMVMQEWPTAWKSHLSQPYDILEETVRLNILRLRNNPSLVMWGAGNELFYPYGEVIDMMGRLSIELDGTRPFHRGEPWGGSVHNYDCYWGRKHLDHNLNMTADFFGEFGLACMPVYESVQRYLPDDEKMLWPPKTDGAFAYHTPIFNTADDLSRLTQYASYFVPKECSMEEFITGSQLSQAVGLRHTLERARTRWPYCTGALYYKMNDNFPAASWACADWYGAPKIGYYACQDSFAPLHACILFETLNFSGTPQSFPVYLLDDSDSLRGHKWMVAVKAFDNRLREIRSISFSGEGSIVSPQMLGCFELTWEETDSTPLLFVVEVTADNQISDRTFYFANYEADKGCLFRLPRTNLSRTEQTDNKLVIIRNEGSVPAVAVNVQRPGFLDTFTVSDNYFWLDAGEEKSVEVNCIDGIIISAWNL